MLKYRFAKLEDVVPIKNLLEKNDLPIDGVERHFKDFIVVENNAVLIGAVGLEIYEKSALFRSLVVDQKYRSENVGKLLIERIKAHALLNDVKDFYLLTTAARDYFLQLGFIEMERDQAPQEILITKEFQNLCPSTATCLKLNIENQVQYYPKDILKLKPAIKGAKMWAVSLQKTMFTYFEAEPNCIFEKHSHESEQITFVFEGKLYFELHDEVKCVSAGESIAIPSNVPHAVFTKDEKVIAVDAWSPIMEKYRYAL